MNSIFNADENMIIQIDWIIFFNSFLNLKMASLELACVYAALILNDDNIEITKEKMNSILNIAGVQVKSYLIDLFLWIFQKSWYRRTH